MPQLQCNRCHGVFEQGDQHSCTLTMVRGEEWNRALDAAAQAVEKLEVDGHIGLSVSQSAAVEAIVALRVRMLDAEQYLSLVKLVKDGRLLDGYPHRCCVVCEAEAPYEGSIPHEDDCALVLLLRKESAVG